MKVGHDFTIEGSPDFPFVFDGLCDLHVARDLRVTDRTVNLGIGLGGQCAGNGAPGRTRSAATSIVTGNHARVRRSSARRRSTSAPNHVGRDLVFSNNTAVPGGCARSCPGTPSAATRPAPRTTRPSRSTRRTSQGARTPAASKSRSEGPVSPGPHGRNNYIPIEWYPESTYSVVPVTFFASSESR